MTEALAEHRAGIWDCTKLPGPAASVALAYGADGERTLFLSRREAEFISNKGLSIDGLDLIVSDFINITPTLEEAKPFNVYGSNWLGKHNNGVPLFMGHLMLDLPVMRVSTVYNWREGPIITRDKNGTICRNQVTYQTKGFPFGG